ncbi:MAG: hypothetical protein BWY74_02885 [Firmicutes bacterium ADurb.Bin419]|nr:MAG: hypothetical protein BWY74_02885 [Firmicutes bacterium ADurb.Bin419]
MTAVTVYTMSMYVRIPAGSSLQYVQLVGSSGWADSVESYANFDIINGALGNSGSVVVDKGIEDHGNGVYRIWMALPTVAVPTAGSTSCIISFIGALTDARTVSTTFATTSYYVDVLCPQLEIGYARTSAIPTTGVAATRSRDSLSIATGSWYDQTRGTLYLNFIAGENDGTTFRRYLCFNDASLNNVIELGRAGTSTGQSATAVGGSFSYAPTSGTHPAFTEGKMMFGWNNLSKRLSSNGAAVGTNTTAPVYSGITGLTIGGRYNATTNITNGHIKVLKYWPYNYYTSAQLVTLST